MHPYILLILLVSLGLGTTLTFASSHWLLAWMGLEINTLAIIPLMTQLHHPRAVEAAVKYYIVQATATAILLFATALNAWMTGDWNLTHLTLPPAIATVTMALALKVGLAPLHLWLPEVLQGLDLTTGLILSTWQKLAPLALLIQMSPAASPFLLITLGLSSTLFGGWGGLNQTQARKILAYSSIAHLGWMILIIQYMPQLSLLTLVVYIFTTTAAFLSLKAMSATKINTLALAWTKTPMISTMAALTFLSLGGLPPLTGFMPKWLIIDELTKQDMPAIATVAALSALLSLYFYLRLCYTMAMTSFPHTNHATSPWRLYTQQPSLPLTISTILGLSLLPLTPAILTLVS